MMLTTCGATVVAPLGPVEVLCERPHPQVLLGPDPISGYEKQVA